MKRYGPSSIVISFVALVLAGCGGESSNPSAGVTPVVTAPAPTPTQTPTPTPAPRAVVGVQSQAIASIPSAWSMAFLPDGRLLVTERPPTPATLLNPTEPGRLRLVTAAGVVSSPITGLPANAGLLDVKIDPDFALNGSIFVSFMERDPAAPRVGRAAGTPGIDPAGLAVMRGTLVIDAAGNAQIAGASVIWRQFPKVVSDPGSGEPGGRMVFSADGLLFVTAGDRQELAADLIQRTDTTIGKTVRLRRDGSAPVDNPFVGRAGYLPEIWSIGHRNHYGLAFNAAGALWSAEMGPSGGDEFNLIASGANYGWPLISEGSNYGGPPYPRPAAGDGFAAAALAWTPVIAPSDMIFYAGTLFGDWNGDAIVTGLQSRGLVRVRVNGSAATEVQRIAMGARIRSIVQAPDGAIWVLEDGATGRLLRLTPTF